MIVRESLEAAIVWLLDNVLAENPTHYEFDQIHNSKWCIYGDGERCRAASEGMRMLLASKRRMFLAPEPTPQSIVTHVIDPVAAAVRDKLKGWTLPKPDADLLIGRLIEEVRLATRTEP